jgi:hypothetical protein
VQQQYHLLYTRVGLSQGVRKLRQAFLIDVLSPLVEYIKGIEGIGVIKKMKSEKATSNYCFLTCIV